MPELLLRCVFSEDTTIELLAQQRQMPPLVQSWGSAKLGLQTSLSRFREVPKRGGGGCHQPIRHFQVPVTASQPCQATRARARPEYKRGQVLPAAVITSAPWPLRCQDGRNSAPETCTMVDTDQSDPKRHFASHCARICAKAGGRFQATKTA